MPYEEMIRWCQKRIGLVIGDFGCGEAKRAEALADRHTVHSFDHVAVNDGVVACEMTHVPLGDETLDVAIFSLSLMGANFTDYLRESHRTLKLDGRLHIIEATARFTDRDRFVRDLQSLGFDVVLDDLWKLPISERRKPNGSRDRGLKSDSDLSCYDRHTAKKRRTPASSPIRARIGGRDLRPPILELLLGQPVT